ncbi:MAG TPA: polysaccharide pyruvyl transferase family protein [Noviherbaspirillum sp.]|uniref:polysaccharide pyruvyl transferase family protein n=1 Tax=Noviherbaspirillum sp. TaxID=1926288 RepID=UPI002F94B4C6
MVRPCIVFGAFDRHNFGDLLFPHILAALLPDRPLVFTGLAARDLTPFGGHRTLALADVAAQFAGEEVDIVHAGGEVLTCSAWQAAAMLLPSADATAAIAYLESDPVARAAFVRDVLRVPSHAPYTAGRALFPRARRVIYNGVGGVGLAQAAAVRDEVFGKLRDADLVGVRDRDTLAALAAAGVGARLMADPAVLTAALFGGRISARIAQGPCAAIAAAFPRGYVAVQCSADFGDDGTLAALASSLDAVARRTGLGAVLFLAGTAPWHDDRPTCARLLQKLSQCQAQIFPSLDVFDICALVAGSTAYCGSSLHGRIIAMAFGRPRVSLCRTHGESCAKAAAFAACWDPEMPCALPQDAGRALQSVLGMSPAALDRAGAAAAVAYHQAFDTVRAALA